MNSHPTLLNLTTQIEQLEKWVNSSLEDKIKASEKDKNILCTSAKMLNQCIRDNRIVTKQKILIGLTQWSCASSQTWKESGYLLTAYCCEMLKEVIQLQREDDPIISLSAEQNNIHGREKNKHNDLCYSLKLLLQKQEKLSLKQKQDYEERITELQASFSFEAERFETFLAQSYVPADDPNAKMNQYVKSLINVCKELKKNELNASKTWRIQAASATV
ncbi:hypothetical protein RFI36_20445 [Acinetobacter gerneri]|uniref:Uncharacterized protein n=1 Tax=Acinetobacter gerneri TaxID=202952 RepID=A0AAW8JQL2_9GAMM|nr:hypothetical protein [Acinetobacter gerneri]MDQ9012091.1 hypothetical protein [Acinetobacter gerneri]MDQ9016195.1 hypothetical protein [Acinetobacter gerneri]MDQ9027404.1 hypothetical protein [Acinetobacter gerneri]MDQ9054660.1 hypothetical protein [Acinetobacter gerneri]MDQ9062306.1 hypothetical protein [Acinetobacter gerneri]